MPLIRSWLPLILAVWVGNLTAGEPAPDRPVGRLAVGGDRAGCTFLSFSADGKQLVTVQGTRTARLWDVGSAKVIRSVTFDRVTDVWTVTPNRSALIGVDDQLGVHRWSLAADRPGTTVELREARQLDIGLRAREAHVLPDGTLALLAIPKAPDPRLNRHCVSFWEPTTGKLVRWGGDPGLDFRGDYARLSPDGRFTAAFEATFDTRTGARRGLPASPFGLGGVPLYSPDGRLLAVTARDTRVWDLATGRVVADLPINSTERATFSPDGRRLACVADDRIAVWDVGLRQSVIDGPVKVEVGAQAFSPDGRTLATGHADGTILLWAVPAPVVDGRWSEADANEAWEALAGDLSASGYPVVWQLADRPAEVVHFLRGKVALDAVASSDEIARLVAGLDSPRFAEREAASKRLRQFGRAAERPLRRALQRELSPEQIARIEASLAGLEPVARPRGDDLRAVRAVAVLEFVGADAARGVLAAWADRAASPTVADEAGRALARWKARE